MDQLILLACVIALACCWVAMVRAKRPVLVGLDPAAPGGDRTVYFMEVEVNPEVYSDLVNQIIYPRGVNHKSIREEWREIWRGGGRVVSMKRTN